MTIPAANGNGESWAAVIRQAQQWDADAFDAIIERYSAKLYGFLYRFTGRPDDAEELVQEVFVRVVRMIRQYKHEGRFEAWLFRIAVNVARDRARRLKRARGLVSLESAGDAGRDGMSQRERFLDPSVRLPEEQAVLAEDVDLLQRAMARLPDAEREVILMRHYSRMSFADIAQVMGTPLGTALARAHRGLAKLRKWMEISA
jgi:RNA polymerase sigma-70 factor (ECF subfamily)